MLAPGVLDPEIIHNEGEGHGAVNVGEQARRVCRLLVPMGLEVADKALLGQSAGLREPVQ